MSNEQTQFESIGPDAASMQEACTETPPAAMPICDGEAPAICPPSAKIWAIPAWHSDSDYESDYDSDYDPVWHRGPQRKSKPGSGCPAVGAAEADVCGIG